MSIEVQNQFYLFFMSIFWGMGMCVVYDGLRILRNIIRHKLRWINIEDFFYWLCMTIVLFYLLFTYNRGEIRGYIFGGMALGSFFYLNTISPVLIAAFCWFLNPFVKLLRKVVHLCKKTMRFFADKH